MHNDRRAAHRDHRLVGRSLGLLKSADRNQQRVVLISGHNERLATQLLQALPHVAMIIGSDRVIAHVNEPAKKAGIVPGEKCWDAFGGKISLTDEDRSLVECGGSREGIKCKFCMADQALGNDTEMISNVEVEGVTWRTHWNPIGSQQFLHYGVEIEAVKEMGLIEDASFWHLRTQEIAKLGYWTQDLESGVLEWSDNIFEIFGVPSAEFDFDAFLSLVSSDDRRAIIDATQNAVEHPDDGAYSIEYQANKPNGDRIHLHEEAFILHGSHGAPDRLVGIVQDVTERTNAASQLRHNSKMQAVGQLAGGVAHGFNNILGVIMGETELSLLDDPRDSVRTRLESIKKQSQRASQIVSQLLTFSRRTVAQRRPIKLVAVINDSLDLMRVALPPQITIERDFIVPDAAVDADENQLSQVIMNLVTNAEHSIGHRGGVITVALTECGLKPRMRKSLGLPEIGPYFKLTIRDTGAGISAQNIDRVFEPFFTTKEVGSGTGLGLSVAHTIVSDHDGVITVDSVEGQGATFDVFLPQTVIDPQGSSPRGMAMDDISARVLLVDDEPVVLSVMARMLSSLGCEVDQETDPLAVTNVLDQGSRPYDMVILDVAMPGMNGKELRRLIRESHPDLPVVAVSGNIDGISLNEVRELGFSSYLQKPVSLQDLVITLKAVLEDD